MLLPVAMCGVHKSWTAAVLVKDAVIASVHALDSWDNVRENDIFMNVVKTILTEGRFLEVQNSTSPGNSTNRWSSMIPLRSASLHGIHVERRVQKLVSLLEQGCVDGDFVKWQLLCYFDLVEL